MIQVYWARPKDDDSRAFDTGYCSKERPMAHGGSLTEAELFRRGFVKVVEKSAYDELLKRLTPEAPND